jgi:hypothetical protein
MDIITLIYQLLFFGLSILGPILSLFFGIRLIIKYKETKKKSSLVFGIIFVFITIILLLGDLWILYRASIN